MDCDAIAEAWTQSFGGTPPVGFLLREALPQRWLRIHSLPESKRYPESEAEHREILRRHNRVATDILGTSSDCAVIVLTACDYPIPEELVHWTNRFVECERLPASFWEDEDAMFGGPMCLIATPLTWFVGVADDLIRAAALDRIRPVVLNRASGRAYAPYDGGADLFFTNEPERNSARQAYSEWLSDHPSGL